MHNRLVSFFDTNNTLNSSQYGFQKQKSTSHAILEMLSHVSDAKEMKSLSCCIFLDLAKAFDTINHNILLTKLHHYGIRGTMLNWFKSYLSNRKQSVSISQCLSPSLNMNCGVPQGSILGPLLFILYINDISNVSKIFKIIQFADDTCLFLSAKNKEDLERLCNQELVKISDWLTTNALSINVKKSNFLFFSNSKQEQQLNLQLIEIPIEQKQVVRYLGIEIDDQLNWTHQVRRVKQKITQGLGILRKVKYLIPPKFLSNIYASFIQSHLLYGNLIWASPNTQTNCLNKLITKSHKILNNLNQTKPLNLNQLYKTESCKLIHDLYSDKLPINLYSIFTKANQIHHHQTRQAVRGLHIPHHVNRSFPLPYFASSFWNQYCAQSFTPNTSKSSMISNLKSALLSE